MRVLPAFHEGARKMYRLMLGAENRWSVTAWLGMLIVGAVGVTAVMASVGFHGATVAERGAVVCSVVAHCGLVFAGTLLTAVDLRERRLPNAIVLPLLAGTALAFAVAALLVGDLQRLMHALLAGLILFGSYFALAVAVPGSMGFGDVKLAAALGMFLGWHGPAAFVVGATTPFILGGLWAGVLILARRANRRSAVPFGPWMLLGAWLGIGAVAVAAGG